MRYRKREGESLNHFPFTFIYTFFFKAEILAKEIAQKEGGAYIPPFDHPDVWEGNATMVEELVQSASVFPGGKPGAVVTVCGTFLFFISLLPSLFYLCKDTIFLVLLR
jgi:hypothetical protein